MGQWDEEEGRGQGGRRRRGRVGYVLHSKSIRNANHFFLTSRKLKGDISKEIA